MFLEKKKLISLLGLLGWAILVFFTFWNIRAVFSYSCYFLSSWPFCNGANNAGAVIVQGAVLFFVFFIFAVLSYLSFKSLFEREKMLGWLAVGVFLGAAFCLLPFASSDTQFYFSLGKAVNSGVNPYVEPWSVENRFYFPPKSSSVTGVMYGPIALDVFVGFYKLSGGNEINFVLLWKIFMLVILAACGFLVWKIISTSVLDKKVFYIFWLTQPLLLFEWVGNGHFDGLWLLFVFLAFIFARKNQWGLVVVSLIIGTWIKFIPLLIAPWFLLWWWQEVDKNNWIKRLSFSVGGGVVAVLVSLLIWWPYWQGVKVFTPLLLQSKWAVSSLFAALYYTLKPLAVYLFADQAHWLLTRFLHLTIFCLALYFFWPLLKKIIAIVRHQVSWSVSQYSLVMFLSLLIYLLVWQKSFWPWYAIWLIVIGLLNYLLTKNNYLGKILIWLSAASLFFYVPVMMWGGDNTSVVFYWYVFVLVAFYPLWQLWLWRKIDYDL